MIYISCPCGKKLGFKDEHGGRRGSCPECKRSFVIPAPVLAEAAFDQPVPAPPPRAPAAPQPMDALPLDDDDQQQDYEEPAPRAERKKRKKLVPKKKANEGGGFWGPESAGIRYGVAGGLIMMAIAVVWFIVGLYLDRIFFYPPILFVIGLFALIKGLATGNLAGRRDED